MRTYVGLLSLLALLACRGQPLHTRSTTKYCWIRNGQIGKQIETCFGLRLKMGFAGGSGLINQHLTMLSFLTLGIASGCSELLVEHSPRRKHTMSSSEWEHQPLDSLWDADQLSKYLEGHSIRLLLGHNRAHPAVQPLEPFEPLSGLYEDIGDAVSAMRRHVLGELTELPGLSNSPGEQLSYTVEVAITNIFMGLRTGQSHLYRDVARHTQMAPHLQSLAQTCIERMDLDNASYVGIHLRVEDDFERMGRTGGRQNLLSHYNEAIRQQAIAPEEQLYIASGIFSTEPDFVERHLQSWPSHITHRGLLLSAEESSGLDVEQLAAIDFLVVCKAAKFIGWQGSSFSFWVPEERALHGLDHSTSLVINGAEKMDAEHHKFAVSHGVVKSEHTRRS